MLGGHAFTLRSRSAIACNEYGHAHARNALFPERGDAPGSDLPDVPRPPRALRTLTATTPGRSSALRLYDSALSRDALTKFYEVAMARHGWMTMGLPPELDFAPHEDVRVFLREGRALAVTIADGAAATRSVTLIDLGGVRGRIEGEASL